MVKKQNEEKAKQAELNGTMVTANVNQTNEPKHESEAKSSDEDSDDKMKPEVNEKPKPDSEDKSKLNGKQSRPRSSKKSK